MDGSASGTGHCAADEERRREIRKEIAKIHDSVEDAEKITYEELSAKLRTSFEGVGNINQWRTDVMAWWRLVGQIKARLTVQDVNENEATIFQDLVKALAAEKDELDVWHTQIQGWVLRAQEKAYIYIFTYICNIIYLYIYP
jgi:hypothetical protein